MGGKKIVLAASNSESSEYLRSTWRQMLLATLPARFGHHLSDISVQNDVQPDGQACYVPNGLRVVEATLLQKHDPDDIAVCYPEQLDRFVGDDTRAVGIHAHNPLGITFAADVYAQFYGYNAEPINAQNFRSLILHPALRRHKDHLKVIVGGPGAWQIEKRGLQNEWRIDCIVHGEAEDEVLPLFEAALRGGPLPRSVECRGAEFGSIPPRIRHRSTFGAVEITRGCGRGCQFCSVGSRSVKSIPLDHILDNVRTQAAEGADMALLVTEDIFLYDQRRRFETNVPALQRLFESVATVDGIQYISMTHGSMAPIVKNPEILDALSPIAVGRSVHQHRASTHPDKRYACLFVGIETASVRLFKQFMKGKAFPYRPEQWPDVILKGMELMNQHNWFPICSWIVGLPGETAEDTRMSLELLYALKESKWIVVPTLFVPLEDTRLEDEARPRFAELSDLQWEFFFTCWRYNLDFFATKLWDKAKFSLGIPIYYYLLGRRMFGKGIKYPLLRLGCYPEWLLRRNLYLDFGNGRPAHYKPPAQVEIPQHAIHSHASETGHSGNL